MLVVVIVCLKDKLYVNATNRLHCLVNKCDYLKRKWDKTGFLEQISRFFRDKIAIYRHFLENFQIDFWGIFGPCIPGGTPDFK